jgi:hypothetical protein
METDLKMIAEENAKAPYIKRERVKIEFALPGVVRLILSTNPRHVTGKPTFFHCRSGWEYHGDVEVHDAIH